MTLPFNDPFFSLFFEKANGIMISTHNAFSRLVLLFHTINCKISMLSYIALMEPYTFSV